VRRIDRITLGIALGLLTLCGAAAASGPDLIAVPQPAVCITPNIPCVAIPITLTDNSGIGVRAYSVTLTLSPNLQLCGLGIVSGGYLLAGSNPPPAFFVTQTGPNTWVVDEATLGPSPCGATGGGVLFLAHVASNQQNDTGTISVTAAKLRDCSNADVPFTINPPARITIKNEIPPGLTTLASAQQKTGNAAGSRTRINLAWNTGEVENGASVHVWRKNYGNYPEYDDGPNPGAVPAIPATEGAAASSGWTMLPANPSSDLPPTRDFWYYVAFQMDACGNTSPVSNLTAGSLDYHLGDVSDGVTACQGDNVVNTADLSLLGANYGVTISDPDALGCLDVGPTTDHSTNTMPTTDNVLDFEDLVMFAINFTPAVSAPFASVRAVGTEDALAVEAPAEVAPGETFTASLRLQGAGDLQALSAHLAWNAAVARPIAVAAGALISDQNGVVFSSEPGDVDAALLGERVSGMGGEGELASVTFRALTAGEPGISLARAEGRDAANHPIRVTGPASTTTAARPGETALAPVAPNPFREATTVAFSLAHDGPVELAIYSVDGRRVRTLLRDTREAGNYRVVWNGSNERGGRVAPGLYYARLNADHARFTRTIALIR
jgi:hypothetical protein